MKLLVTGGAGFIGSHTCISLLECNHEVVIIDSHINSSVETIDKIRNIQKNLLSINQLILQK